MSIYEIRVQGQLDQRWSAWFDGLTISYDGSNTVLRGSLADEAALHGVLLKIRDLALPLLSLSREGANGSVQEGVAHLKAGRIDASMLSHHQHAAGETEKKGQAHEPADADGSTS
jgi:hypothetical protein